MRKKGTLINTLLLGWVLFLFTACESSNVIYEENQTFEDNTWDYEDKKAFTFATQDSLTPVRVFLNLRTTIDYPFSNIYMYLYSDYPNGVSRKDTLEFFLAQPDGKWLGDKSGSIIENHALIMEGYLMNIGEYTFTFEQAMYDNHLPEVLDMGLKVERIETEK